MHIDTELLARYDRGVPRYTSYPTAPHFTEQVGTADYRRWLAAIPVDSAVSVYGHIPFCDSLCWFCGCHTKIVRRYDPIAAYLVRTTHSGWALSVFKAGTVGLAVLVLFSFRRYLVGEIGSWCGVAILVVVSLMWGSYSAHFETPQDVQVAQSGVYGDAWLMIE